MGGLYGFDRLAIGRDASIGIYGRSFTSTVVALGVLCGTVSSPDLRRVIGCDMVELRFKVGVIVPPRYFDTAAEELQTLSPRIDVLHTQMRLDQTFDYELDEMAETAGEIEQCAVSLVDAGAEVVLQLGTPFSSVHGWERGSELQQSISDRLGVPFEMMGLSVPAGVHALRATRVAVACVYYPTGYTAHYSAFLTGAGLEVVGARSFVDQGLSDDVDTVWAQSFEGFEPALVMDSIIEVGERFPEAEAIVVPGIPGKILSLIPAAETAIGTPIVSYYALWWKCLTHLQHPPGGPSGNLFALLN